jgi:hypothetical protein
MVYDENDSDYDDTDFDVVDPDKNDEMAALTKRTTTTTTTTNKGLSIEDYEKAYDWLKHFGYIKTIP